MKAALYARVSANVQNLDLQLDALKKYADDNKLEYDIYHEKESTRNSRPVKYELYNKLLKEEYKRVVVWRLDRWARTAQECMREMGTLYEKGVHFVSLTENIDLSTASGILYFHMLCAFNQFERDVISERTKAAFYKDKDGITRSRKTDKPVGKRGKDKKVRRKSGYYLRWKK